MKIRISNPPETGTAQHLVPVRQNQKKALSQLASMAHLSVDELQHDFKGEAGEVHTLYIDQRRVTLLGLGEHSSPNDLARSFRVLSHKHSGKLAPTLLLDLSYCEQVDEMLVETAVCGLLLGTYRIGKYKSDQPDEAHPLTGEDSSLTIIAPLSDEEVQKAANRGAALAHTQMSIMDLVNAPSNKKPPQALADWAVASGQQYGYQVEAMDKARIRELGLHALLAVNQGSPTPPYFIVMEYRPEGDDVLPRVGLVGKGVTFDAGGVSIKSSTNMHFMKSDMGGAAAVLGTMEMAAKLQLPVHLIGIVPTTDNSIDANAIKPSDVIDSYSGKTIEIIDTDAEGRLILADGIAYMLRHFQPETLIDLATLTGSAVRTFGYHAGALFSNNDQLADQLLQTSQTTGERLWRLPIWDVYKEDLKSDVADVRNYSGRPLAGAIGAAKFLETFINDHPRWAHMDIAGVAFGDTEFSVQKSASAFGVRLLVHFLENLE